MILGGRHTCMIPKLVGIRWFLITQMNIKLRGISVKFAQYRILDFRGRGPQFSSAYIL